MTLMQKEGMLTKKNRTRTIIGSSEFQLSFSINLQFNLARSFKSNIGNKYHDLNIEETNLCQEKNAKNSIYGCTEIDQSFITHSNFAPECETSSSPCSTFPSFHHPKSPLLPKRNPFEASGKVTRHDSDDFAAAAVAAPHPVKPKRPTS